MTRSKSKSDQHSRIVLMTGSKGGCGKSTMARNMLVAAKQAGMDVLGIDMDQQATLLKWSARRERARETLPECVPIPVLAAQVTRWSEVLSGAVGRDLVVIDTPPSVEQSMPSLLALAHQAHLSIVPTGSTNDDLESVMPWMRTLLEAGARAEFVMNKVNPRTRSFQTARGKLLKVGKICTVEIPQLEDIHLPSDRGLVPLDFDRGKAVEALDAVWTYVRREVGL